MGRKNRISRQDNKKIESIHITDEMLEDPEMDELLRRQVMEEADEFEKSLNSDPSLIGVGASADMFQAIKERLQEQGIWEEEPDKEQRKTELVSEQKLEELYRQLPKEDLEAMQLGRKVKHKRWKRRKRLSVAGVAVALLIGVGVSGQASRRWIINIWNNVASVTGLRMSIDYIDDKENKEDGIAEENAWKEIKEDLDVNVVDFGYLPPGMVFDSWQIEKDAKQVSLFYLYQNNFFTVRIFKADMNKSIYFQSGIESERKGKVVTDGEIEIEIWDTSAANSESYLATFKYDDCFYYCSGRLSYSVFKNIIKSINLL